jgi:ATP-dependent Zn protease
MANNFFDFNDDDGGGKKRKDGKPKLPTAIWYVMAILILIGIQVTFLWSNTTLELPYSEFRKQLDKDNIESVKISPTRVFVRTKEELPLTNQQNNSLIRQRTGLKESSIKACRTAIGSPTSCSGFSRLSFCSVFISSSSDA